ncbi:MAG: glycosyl hydrolase [Proteobacteria bacterium]|nr:glycosyl hydrolase [Pseudomonadota bacterium]
MAGCATTGAPRSAAVSGWASSADGTRKLAPLSPIPLVAASPASGTVVTVDPARRQQAMVGFGAAMTDASAMLIQGLPAAQRQALLADLFGREGLGIAFVRVPIGASDFSAEHYSLDDMPTGQADPDLRHFTMAQPLRHQIPMLRAARAANPDLVLMASPWSAPGWMKDSGSLIKGRLKPESYDAFARYFDRYLDAMAAQGLPIRYLTVQNEPHFEPADYPGMRFDPEERARFLKQALGPLLTRRRQPVGVLDWDHNWDRPQDPLAVLADQDAARYVSGVAWHCYAGDPAVMEQVRAAHPEKDVFFTECSGGQWSPNWGEVLGWMTDNLIIAPSRAGSRGTLLWNLALDENHGPHKGGCGDCRGVVTIDSRTVAITRNVEYYVLGQVSRFVRPGARRVASDGGDGGDGDLRHVAFVNPDGRTVLLIHNAAAARDVTVRDGTRQFTASLPAGEVATFVWAGAPSLH